MGELLPPKILQLTKLLPPPEAFQGWPNPGLFPLSEQRAHTHGQHHSDAPVLTSQLDSRPLGPGTIFYAFFPSLNSRSSIPTCGING